MGKIEINHITLAIWPIGNRLTGAFPYYSRIAKIRGVHCGLFYEMDWSKAPYNNNIEQHSKVHLEIHYM